MKNVKYNQVAFQVPESWIDESMIVWTGPKKKSVAPTICIAHSEYTSDQSFEAYASDQQKELMNAVKSYVLHEKVETTFQDCQCIKTKHSWKGEGPRITQLQYTILTKENVLLAATCTHLTAEFDQSGELFIEMLNSLEIL